MRWGWFAVVFLGALAGCQDPRLQSFIGSPAKAVSLAAPTQPPKSPFLVVHAVVALCDNKYQRILPVPARIGNGDDLVDNLYWGADYGVKSYFMHTGEWKLVSSTKNPAPMILERIVLKNKNTKTLLIADAFQGRHIKEATQTFLRYAAGQQGDTLQDGKIGIGGYSDLVAYVGHDGLMEDFKLDAIPVGSQPSNRQAAALCCDSGYFFAPGLKAANAEPLLWTKSLMAPEAYVLEAAIQSAELKEHGNAVVERASKAYAKYQKISLKSARTVFVSGYPGWP